MIIGHFTNFSISKMTWYLPARYDNEENGLNSNVLFWGFFVLFGDSADPGPPYQIKNKTKNNNNKT